MRYWWMGVGFWTGLVLAQDPLFLNQNRVGIHASPALIGIDPCARLYAYVQDQGPRLTDTWTGRSNAYLTWTLGGEAYVSKLRGVLALQALGDYTAGGLMQMHQLALAYAYRHYYRKQGKTQAYWQLGVSLQGRAYQFRRQDLVFGDQIDFYWGLTEAASPSVDHVQDRYFFSGGLGFAVVSPKLIAGVALHHITQLRGYRQTMYQARGSLHLGSAFLLREELYLIPWLLLDVTGRTTQMEVLPRLHWRQWSIALGGWSGLRSALDGLLLNIETRLRGFRLSYTLGLWLHGPAYSAHVHEVGAEGFLCPKSGPVSVSECPVWK